MANPEIKAVKLETGAVVVDLFSVGRTALVQLVNLKDDLPALPFDGQRSRKPERIPISSWLDPGALKADLRITFDLQKVCGPQVCVAALASGINTRGLDRDLK